MKKQALTLFFVAAVVALSGCSEDALGTMPSNCDNGYVMTDQGCILQCEAGFRPDGDECVPFCPQGYEQIDVATCAIVCEEGWLRVDNNTCAIICPEGWERVNNTTCQEPCPEGYSRNDAGECQIDCPEGYVPETLDTCVIDCPEGSEPIGTDACSVVCPAGWIQVSPTECECPQGYEPVSATQCGIICPAGFHRVDNETCAPDCAPGTIWTGQSCEPLGTVEGRFCDWGTGFWHSGAVVSLNGNGSNLSAITGSDGLFSFVGVPPGDYSLDINFPLGGSSSSPVQVTAGEVSTVGDAECYPPNETQCGNGLDDDHDGAVDCYDIDCTGKPECREVCNGLDDDKDGVVDNNLTDATLGDPCYGGASVNAGVGECDYGVIACIGGGLTCDGWVAPTAELCDLLDNDCNGVVPPGELSAGTIHVDLHQQVAIPKVDILFVVDNSGSMSSAQTNLANNFSAFISQFTAAATVDWHIGVTTTDCDAIFGQNGRLVGPFITPLTPNPTSVFTSQVNVGTSGSATERGLQASSLAVSASVSGSGNNAGFLRAGALLSVVYVTDEDDFSSGTPASHAMNLINAKGGDPSMVLASAIAGNVPSGCSGNNAYASAATRYNTVVNQFGGVFASICAANWANSLQAIATGTLNALNQFQLSKPAEESTIVVTVCAGSTCVQVPHDPVNGWSYDPVNHTIILNGSSVPAGSANIEITYGEACVL